MTVNWPIEWLTDWESETNSRSFEHRQKGCWNVHCFGRDSALDGCTARKLSTSVVVIYSLSSLSRHHFGGRERRRKYSFRRSTILLTCCLPAQVMQLCHIIESLIVIVWPLTQYCLSILGTLTPNQKFVNNNRHYGRKCWNSANNEEYLASPAKEDFESLFYSSLSLSPTENQFVLSELNGKLLPV